MNWEIRPHRLLKLLGLVLGWTIAGVGGPIVLLAIWLIFAPGVDDLVGGISGKALQVVQNHREGTKTVREIVASRYRNPKWRAFHRDYLEETYVRCDALTQFGEPVAMMWVVISQPEWNGLAPRVKFTATAHNQAAYIIAHSLYEKGHTLYGSADMGNW